ncbi:MAG: ABC transporter ATP-binding protein, partial [Pseudomonadota bacterium]
LMPPSGGRVAIDGTTVSEPRDEIGIVFQRPTLLPWLNIRDNVVFPIRHKRGESGKRYHGEAHALLDMVGLGDFAKHMPEQLSGGMQQRAAIARALLLDPDILLMDEPFSALDALTRDEMGFELLRIWEERPKTVVFITHAISEAVLLSDRVVIMSPRPGAIHAIVEIDLPRPRTIETMTSPRFVELSNEIRSGVLHRIPVAA